MTELLSEADIGAALSAFKDVADTFFRETATYHRRTVKLDRFQEDRAADDEDTDLLCRGTILGSGAVDVLEAGSVDFSRAELTFNMEYLAGYDLVLSGEAIFRAEEDEFTYRGKRCRIIGVHYGDTDFVGTKVLCVVLIENLAKPA